MNRRPPAARNPLLTLAAAILIIITAPPAAHAQQLAPVPLTTPLTVEALGLTLQLPDNASAETNSIPGGRTTTTITPAPTPGLTDAARDWFITVYNLESNDRTLTPNEALDAFLAQREAALQRQRAQLVTLARIGDETPLAVGENANTAARAYTTAPQATPVLSGYTIVAVAPGSFLVFQLATGDTTFNTDAPTAFANKHILTYESIIASATIEDPALARLESIARFNAGAALLAIFSTEDITLAIQRKEDQPDFVRIYRPATTGRDEDAEEIAFQRIAYRIGQLGELDDDTPKSRWSARQREFGFLVEVQARTTNNSITADTNAAYFLATNLEDEFWSTTTTTTTHATDALPETRSVARETLIRRGDAITVTIEETARPEWTRDWNIPPAEQNARYLPRVLLYILPHLVADHFDEQPTALDCSFYAYDSSLRRLTTREDSFDNLERTGWLHVSSPAPERPDITSTRDRNGDLVARELPAGIRAEPTTREKLRKIWLDKGLNFNR